MAFRPCFAISSRYVMSTRCGFTPVTHAHVVAAENLVRRSESPLHMPSRWPDRTRQSASWNERRSCVNEGRERHAYGVSSLRGRDPRSRHRPATSVMRRLRPPRRWTRSKRDASPGDLSRTRRRIVKKGTICPNRVCYRFRAPTGCGRDPRPSRRGRRSRARGSAARDRTD